MNTLETEIEIAADGSVNLLSPLPGWVKPGRAHVVFTLTDDLPVEGKPRREVPQATPETIARRLAALERNPYREIADPVAWTRPGPA